ncbi:MAG: hypothetical protein KAS32_28705 [Candidatus Peribacteraceae bacterium]|nr:hypothetical protein [Candidatus Peribacteraceae bacterium]
MKYVIRKFIAVVCIMLLLSSSFTGCAMLGSGVDFAGYVISLKSDSALVEKQYNKMYILIVAKKDSFTEDEWLQLEDINFAFTETAARIKLIMKSPKNAITPDELKDMYNLAYVGYTTARDIVANHRDAFTNFQWTQMEDFDKKLVDYDVSVREVLDNPDTVDINKTLGLIITLGGAAYKYILPVVLSKL